MLKRFAPLPAQDPTAPLHPRPFWRAVKTIDQQLLRMGPLRRYCGEVIVRLQK
jgi:hypothetical protein